MNSSFKSTVKLFTVLIVSVVFITSCKMEGGSNYTPRIMLADYIRNQHGDTLAVNYYNLESVLDTIEVGDTVSIAMFMNSYTNKLTMFRVEQSADSVSRIILPSKASLDSICIAGSSYKDGLFVFNGEANVMTFPIKYVALKPSATAKITFTVVSDAKFDNDFGGANSASAVLKTPIVVAKEMVE